MRKRARPTLFEHQEVGAATIVDALVNRTYSTASGETRKGHAFLLYDEMGLGKTVQAWEALKRLKDSQQLPGPILIVCPSSVTHVWTAGDRAEYYNDDFQAENKLCDPSQATNSHAVVISYDLLLILYKHYIDLKVPQGRLSNEQMVKYCRINGKSIDRTTGLRGDSYRVELINICKQIERKLMDSKERPFLYQFMEQKWGCIVMDEVQRVKNSVSASCRAVSFMDAHYRIALSGTPVVNHGGELVTIMRMALNLFDLDWKVIKSNPNGHYCTQVLRSFTLGRKKCDIDELKDILPKRDKQSEQVIVPWTDPYQRQRYVQIKQASLVALEELEELKKLPNEAQWEFNQRRLAKNRHFMTKLQRMRQVCLHPDLPFHMDSYNEELGTPRRLEWHPFLHPSFHPWIRKRIFLLMCCLRRCGPLYTQRFRFVKHFVDCEQDLVIPSPKMMELVPYLDRKIVVFSSFKRFLTRIVRPWLSQMGCESLVFCGGSKAEQQRVLKEFEVNPLVKVLLIVKGAGAEGLNLQHSSSVCFIMDPHFNSATDEQASQRIDRIGQEHEVIVRKLFMSGSIDEVMLEMQRAKQINADAWLNGTTKTTGARSLEAQGLFLRQFDKVE